jgi:hypothetical protein
MKINLQDTTRMTKCKSCGHCSSLLIECNVCGKAYCRDCLLIATNIQGSINDAYYYVGHYERCYPLSHADLSKVVCKKCRMKLGYTPYQKFDTLTISQHAY